MISIQLPDGSQPRISRPGDGRRSRRVHRPRPGQGGAGRPTATAASRVVDTSYRDRPRRASSRSSPPRMPTGLEIIRHSTAHLLAYAVKELFPDAQVTIGPVIENGFYYDFAYKRPFTPEDLAAIEAKMAELAQKDEPVTRRVLPRDEAVAHLQARWARHYKAEIIAGIPADEDVSLYREGDVRGPVPRPARAEHRQAEGLQADEGGRRLLARRPTQRDAAAHLRHGLGDQGRAAAATCTCSRRPRSATTASSAASSTCSTSTRSRRASCSGIPKGWALWQAVEQYMRQRLPRQRLPGGQGPADPRQEPVGEDRPLGELPREHVHDGVGEARLRAQADELPRPRADLQVRHLRSYRDLPLRYGEFGQCHRNEPSGALHGIMRVRGFTQDDGHIFCTEDQILDECVAYTAQLQKVYARLRLHRHHLQGRDAAGEPHRLRRALGQGRARADGGAAPLGRASS